MIELQDDNFDSMTEGKLAIIDFWAEWCGPCKAIAPTIEKLAGEVPEGVIVAKVDVDSCPDLGARFQIRNIPTILFIKNGEVVNKHVGVCTLDVLKKKMDESLNNESGN